MDALNKLSKLENNKKKKKEEVYSKYNFIIKSIQWHRRN